MNWQLVSLAEVPASAWRNGGGVTRELLAWPSAVDWQVRISVADVERDGPFSAFPGIARWFAVLDGAGVRLAFDDAQHELTPASAPLQFDGGCAVDCSLLQGATRDFNLMAAPGRARLRRMAGSDEVGCAAGTLVALYAHRSPARIGTQTVPTASLAWRLLDSSERIQLAAADALWMEIAT
jgi:environmental stress-induced protein Ves